MRTLTRALVVYSLLLFSAQAFAEVTLVKADEISNNDSEIEMVTHHRYEDEVKKLNYESDQMTGKIATRDRRPSSTSNANDSMKITLIKVKHRS